MNTKIRIGVVAVGAVALTLAAVLLTGRDRVAVAGDAAQQDERISVIRTAPSGSITSPDEMERNYRSCLFTFLPRIGSDAAAEMLRDACREEYPAALR